MAELQTLSAALQLVTLASATVHFIDKVAKARQEASALSQKVQHLNRLLKNIADHLETREKKADQGFLGSAEGSVENVIQESLNKCRKCLGATNHQLEPLARLPRGQIDGATHRLKWIFTDKFIKRQEKQFENELQTLSVSLTVLQLKEHEECHAQGVHTQRLLLKLIRDVNEYGNELELSSSRSSKFRQELTEALSITVTDRRLIESSVGKDYREADRDDEKVEQYGSTEDENSAAWNETLKIAVKQNQVEAIKELRESGANVYLQDSENFTLLHHAVLQNAEQSLITLLDSDQRERSGWLNVRSKRGFTALMYTAMLADPDKCIILAKTLIESGCNVNIKDSQGRSAICFAIDSGGPSSERRDLVKLLLDNHAEPQPAFAWAQGQAKRYPVLRKHPSMLQRPMIKRAMTSCI